MDSSNNNETAEGVNDSQNSVQQQLAEYRKRQMSRRQTATPTNQAPAEPPVPSLLDDEQREQLLISVDEAQRRQSTDDKETGDQYTYIPPAFKASDNRLSANTNQMNASNYRLNQTLYESKTTLMANSMNQSQFNAMGKSSRTDSVICISQIPVLNIFDMTKQSHNMRRLRQGSITLPRDLECSIVPDDKISEVDLTIIEKEANKKRRKRAKAQQDGDMISPLATARASADLSRRQDAFAEDANDNGGDEEDPGRDQMEVDQLVDDPVAAQINRINRRREVSVCCGSFRRRPNGHLDIMCVKDLDQDFVYMLLFVVGITGCLTLYAVFV